MSSAGKASKGRRSTGPSAKVRAFQKEIKNLYWRLDEEIGAKRKAQGEYAELERKYARIEQSKAVVEMTVREQAERLAYLNGWNDGWTSRQREQDAQRVKEIEARRSRLCLGGGDGGN